jgi:hypothetical protein
MKQREVIELLGGAAAWPLTARAQQPSVPVIEFLSNIPPESYAGLMPAFRRGLKETGFVEGQNVAFQYNWTNSEHDLPALAAAAVARKPALFLGVGGTASALALKKCDHNDPGHLPDRERPCKVWSGRQPQPTGRKSHRSYQPVQFVARQATGNTA